MQKKYNTAYTGDRLNHIAFPMGGIGAGMICLEGNGTLSHVSLRNKPEIFNEPCIFAAVCVKGDKNIARVLEGPVPTRKIFGTAGSGNGAFSAPYGLRRFQTASFNSKFPFAKVTLGDTATGLGVEITGFSPFIPTDADNSSLPVAALEYTFTNKTDRPIDTVFSFNARNFMAIEPDTDSVDRSDNGFILSNVAGSEKPWNSGWFCAEVDSSEAKVNCTWFRGDWFDPLTMAWKDVQNAAVYERAAVTDSKPSPGGTIFVPLKLKAGSEKTVRVMLSWYVPLSDLITGQDPQYGCAEEECDCKTNETYKPWYAGRFADITEVSKYWRSNYDSLRRDSEIFSNCFYDTTLPDEVIEAVAANLTILKSPTVLRQTDGKLWCWEGCSDTSGSCEGSCTHVWNYAQVIPHLFAPLERTLRQTEFHESQDEKGSQVFRSVIPIRPVSRGRTASDGQLGGIMKIYRDWRIAGDTEWLKAIWPKVETSLNFCIESWDPQHCGVLSEPHHNTYDIEFWGPEPMCSSFYLGALKAAQKMQQALGFNNLLYKELFDKGKKYLEEKLFNGEYFYQQIQWEGLKTAQSIETETYSPEALTLFEKEGPKYQYGTGCLSDGVLGAWMAQVCGLGDILDMDKVAGHLRSVHKYNLKKDLSDHSNPQRPGFALGKEGGLLLCTWPNGGALSIPFVYSDEVWTGIEYQAASHMIVAGMVEEGLDIVRTCRDRYDGRVRNPFDEYECGHWYARAMSSYALLGALSGARFDAVEKILYLAPNIKGDFRCFLSTASGYGTVGVKDGKPFVEVKSGTIDFERIEYRPA